jgi:hypothetical protein
VWICIGRKHKIDSINRIAQTVLDINRYRCKFGLWWLRRRIAKTMRLWCTDLRNRLINLIILQVSCLHTFADDAGQYMA